jgi:hypothetical protein
MLDLDHVARVAVISEAREAALISFELIFEQ